MKILVIEDEIELLEVIRDYLLHEGFEVVTATTGIEAVNTYKSQSPHLVITDLMLPDISGEEICTIIRQDSSIPIIMLTAKSTIDDKLNGLSLGADDYMTKPFSLRELVLRVNVFIKRVYGNQNASKVILNKGQFVLDKEARTVSINETPLALTKIEFDLIELFSQNINHVFSRDQLIETLMGYDYIGYDRTIDSHIKNLRKKLNAFEGYSNCITTVYGVGYKMICD